MKCLALLSLMLAAAGAAQNKPLFDSGQQEVTFVLKDRAGITPRLVLFNTPAQSGTADSINYWRDTRTVVKSGVAVDFKGIRFFRSPRDPDRLSVRLVGIKNELELGASLSLASLETGKPLELHFGPVSLGGGIVTGTTDAEMTLQYLPESRTLRIAEVSGQFEWKRLFSEAQKDSGKLTDVTGEVGNLPPGGAILKPPPSVASGRLR